MQSISLELYVEANLQLRPDANPWKDAIPCQEYNRHRLEPRQAVRQSAMPVLFKENILNLDVLADCPLDRAARTENPLEKALPPNHPTLAPGIPGKDIVRVRPR